MFDIKITVLKISSYNHLIKKYENKLDNPCFMKEGDVFISKNATCPPNFCKEAFKTLKPFIKKLANGEGYFYGNWMKDPYSALVSCNDGFRPVSFYLERSEYKYE